MASVDEIRAILGDSSSGGALPGIPSKSDQIRAILEVDPFKAEQPSLGRTMFGVRDDVASMAPESVTANPLNLGATMFAGHPQAPPDPQQEEQDRLDLEISETITDAAANVIYDSLKKNIGNPRAIDATIGFLNAGVDFASVFRRFGLPVDAVANDAADMFFGAGEDLNFNADEWQMLAQKLDQRAGEEAPGMLGDAVRSATRSVVQALTLSPMGVPGVIGGFTTVRANQAITEGKQAGLDDDELTRYVMRAGAIEGGVTTAFGAVGKALGKPAVAGFEGLFTKDGLRFIVQEGLKGVAPRLGKSLGFELLEENVVEVMDNINQAMSEVDKVNVLKEAFVNGNWRPLAQQIMKVSLATTLGFGAVSGIQLSKRITTEQLKEVRKARSSRQAIADALGVSKNALPPELRSVKAREAFIDEVAQELNVRAIEDETILDDENIVNKIVRQRVGGMEAERIIEEGGEEMDAVLQEAGVDEAEREAQREAEPPDIAQEQAQPAPTKTKQDLIDESKNSEVARAVPFPWRDLEVDPERFQFRIEGRAGKKGKARTSTVNTAKVFNPKLAEANITAWQDPETGRVFVVDGHNRLSRFREFEEAGQTIPDNMNVVFSTAATAEEARAVGAVKNIGNGTGTSVDAAKYFKDEGFTYDEVVGMGLPLSEKVVDEGFKLVNLHPFLFDQVVQRTEGMTPARGAIIGSTISDQGRQVQFKDGVRKKEGQRGNPFTLDVLQQLANKFEGTEVQVVEDQQGMLEGLDTGPTFEDTFFVEGEISAKVLKEIQKDKGLFSNISKSDNVKRLEDAGNVIDVAEAKRISKEAAIMEEVFKKLQGQPQIAGVLTNAAQRVARGEQTTTEAVDTASAEIKNVIPSLIRRGESESGAGRAEDIRPGETPAGGSLQDAKERTQDRLSTGTEVTSEQLQQEIAQEVADNQANMKNPTTIEKAFPQGNLFSRDTRDLTVTTRKEHLPNVPDDMPVSNFHVLAEFSRVFNIPIRNGRLFRADAAGVYKTQPEVVRLKRGHEGNLAVVTHEVAHHIDKKNAITQNAPHNVIAELAGLDYDQNRRSPFEGFAEYMRLLWTGDTASQAAPDTTTWFQEFLRTHPSLGDKVAETKLYMNKWRDQDTLTRGKANIVSITDKPYEPGGFPIRLQNRFTNGIHRFYAAWKDDAHYINRFVKEARKLGLERAPGETSIELQRALSQAGPELAQRAFEDGVFSMGENPEKLSGSLRDAIRDIGPEEYEDWRLYVHARHALEVYAKNPEINPGMLEDDAKEIVARLKNDKFDAAHQGLTDFNNALLLMMESAGVISGETATRMINYWETYLPLMRQKQGEQLFNPFGAGTGRSLVDKGKPVRARKGSDLPIIDFVESTVERAMRFYTRASQQLVIDSLIKEAEDVDGLGGFIEEVPPSVLPTRLSVEEVVGKLKEMGVVQDEIVDVLSAAGVVNEDVITLFRPNFQTAAGDPIVRVMQGDDVRLFRVDPELYRGIANVDTAMMPGWVKTWGKATKAFKLGTTGLNINFAVRNVVRDSMTRLIQSESTDLKNLAVDPATMLIAYGQHELAKAQGKKGDPMISLFQGFGGELSGLLGMDRQRQVKERVQMVFEDTAKKKWLRIVGGPPAGAPIELGKEVVDQLRNIVQFSEVNSRLAEFKHVLEREGWTKDRIDKEGMPPRRLIVEAINAAADVTTNFKRMGHMGRVINQLVPFFNARIEGLDKFVRVHRTNKKRAIAAWTAGVASTIGYWSLVKDDDWYKEAPDWLKFGFWSIPDDEGRIQMRIPIPFDWGWMTKAIPEAFLNFMEEKDPDTIYHFIAETANQLNPAGMPSGVGPMMEAYFNYDLFRKRPIVSEGLQRLEDRDQYAPYNTALSKEIGNWLNVSPKKLDFALDGLTGNMYSRVFRSDKAFEAIAAEIGLRDKNLTNSADVPGLGAFRLRSDMAKSMDEMYTTAEDLSKAVNSARLRGPVDPDLQERSKRFDSVSRLVSDINRSGRTVLNRDLRFHTSQKYAFGLSRMVLGKEMLGSYPNPFTDPDAPKDVDDLARAWTARRIVAATNPPPTKRSKRAETEQSRQGALNDLRFTKMDHEDILAQAKSVLMQKYSTKTAAERFSRLKRSLAQ